MANKSGISVKKIFEMIAILAISIIGGYFLGDHVRASEKPSEYIAVIFSILAASLFAVISIVGDPGMLISGSAKKAWQNARELQKELYKFYYLFYLYLITLGLLVASELAEHAGWCRLYWLSNLFTGCAIAGFLLSFRLPADFKALQKRRLEQEINSRLPDKQ